MHFCQACAHPKKPRCCLDNKSCGGVDISIFEGWTGSRRVERLEDDIRDLSKRTETVEAVTDALERRTREVELEWLDAYEKFRSLYGRISKRVERAEKAEEPEEPEETPAPNPLALKLLERGTVRS